MLRKLLVSLLSLLVVTVLLFGAALALAQTRLAKDQISGLVESSLTSDGQSAEVQDLGGFLPFDVRLGRFSLADDTGTWLEVDEARVTVSPTRLLAGEILVEQAGAARIAVHRAPDLPQRPEPAEAPEAEPFSLPEPPTLPESLPRITVERLFADRIELGEALIGEAAVFNLEGHATTGPTGRAAEARLDLVRIDQPTASLGLGATLDLDADRIGVDLQGSETGGLMAALTGREDAGDLSLTLAGDGPLDDWQAELQFAIERLVTANADLALAYAANPSVDLALRVVPVGGALPPEIEAVLGQRLELALAGGQRAPGHFALDRLTLDSGLVTASGTLEARLDEDRLTGRISVTAADLARASALAGQPLAGRMELTLDALGSFSEPRFTLALDGDGITADTFGVGDLALDMTADLLGPLDQPFAGVRLEGSGQVMDLTQNGEPLRPESGVTLDLAAIVPMEGEARLERFSLAGQHVSVNGTASVTMPELAGTGRLEARVPSVEDLLAALGPAAPSDLAATGAVDLVADIGLAAELAQITVDLAVQGENLAGLPLDLDALVGGDPSITGRVMLRPGESVEVEELEVATAAIGLIGGVRLGLDEAQSLNGRIELSPFALETLEGLIGQPIAGEVTSTLQLAGSLQEPGLDADLRIDNLLIADRSFDRVGLTAQAGETAGRYGGTLLLGVEQAGDTLQLGSDFALEEPVLTLSNLRLSGPTTELSGEARVLLDTLLASGSLSGRVGDLAALEPWTGQPLRGSIDLDARFDDSNGRQDAALDVAVDDLVGDFGTLRQASIEASIEDAMGRLGIDATIQAAGFSQPPPGTVVLEDATVTVSGDRDLFTLDAVANGEMDGPFNIQTKARADVMGETRTVTLDALDGVFQAQSIRLLTPATMRLEGGVLDIDQLDLRIGDARIQGDLNLDRPRDRALASLIIDELPMSMLAEFGGPSLLGDLTGRFDVDGSLSAPLIEGSINIANLEVDHGMDLERNDRLQVPRADVEMNVALQPEGLRADVRVDNLGDGQIIAEFRMPMRLSLMPFAVDLPSTLPLDGTITATSRLEPLVALAALDGQQVEGDLDLDLRLDGTVERPLVTGRVGIIDGRVADAVSGVILSDLVVTLVGEGERLDIEQFSARDQAGGRIELTGGIAIDPDEAFPYRFELTSRELRVLDSDLGRATVTADILMEGSARGGRTSGSIQVPRADLRIPSGGGVTPAALDVEVRGAPEPAKSAQEPTDPADRYTMALDLEVDMPSRIFVRGRGLDTEWGGNLEITGSTRAPIIRGSIDYRRGFLDFLDRRFDIREGRVTFTGGTPPVPEVYIEAASAAPTMTGIVRVSGMATDPEFELSSEPELPQDEVLSQLLFDRDTSSLTPIQGVRLANAVARLEGGGFDAMQAIRDVTGLDVVDFGNSDFGEDSPETTATAGRYVADNVFIAVDQGLSSGATRGRVEIEVLPNITVRGEVEQSRSGVGIEWQMDY
jgi:translocation and assembly module TamB